MVNWAMEIRVRAERRAGELLKAMPKNVGAKGIGTSAVKTNDRTPPKLDELGISKNDSSAWQKLADIPESEFEAMVAQRKASGAPVSTRWLIGGKWTVGQYGQHLRAAYGQTVEGVFQVGRELLQAKEELPHGEFEAMVEKDLPFSVRAAHCYMVISKSANFQNMNNVQILPSELDTLYMLQRLDPATFNAAVAAGKVYPEMTLAEAEALLKGCNTNEPVRR